MHMRTKKWALPELTDCPYYIADPANLKGQWRSLFRCPDAPLEIELGCGKGVFTAKYAHDNPGINLIAIDISTNVLGDARRNIAAAYGDDVPGNVVLTKWDIEEISSIFDPEDSVSKVHILFPNPWNEHTRHLKRRLTHPRQLMQLRPFTAPGAIITLRTDDDRLYEDTLEYFTLCNFAVKCAERDAAPSPYPSEHEVKYRRQGIKVKQIVAEKLPEEPEIDGVEFSREERINRKSVQIGNRKSEIGNNSLPMR